MMEKIWLGGNIRKDFDRWASCQASSIRVEDCLDATPALECMGLNLYVLAFRAFGSEATRFRGLEC